MMPFKAIMSISIIIILVDEDAIFKEASPSVSSNVQTSKNSDVNT